MPSSVNMSITQYNSEPPPQGRIRAPFQMPAPSNVCVSPIASSIRGPGPFSESRSADASPGLRGFGGLEGGGAPKRSFSDPSTSKTALSPLYKQPIFCWGGVLYRYGLLTSGCGIESPTSMLIGIADWDSEMGFGRDVDQPLPLGHTPPIHSPSIILPPSLRPPPLPRGVRCRTGARTGPPLPLHGGRHRPRALAPGVPGGRPHSVVAPTLPHTKFALLDIRTESFDPSNRGGGGSYLPFIVILPLLAMTTT